MTIEEAIKMIKAELECRNRQASGTDRDCIHNNCEECHLLYEQGAEGEQKEALDMAIKALEFDLDKHDEEVIKNTVESIWGEPCDDCISREAVMKCFEKWQPYMATRLLDYEQELKELPSVTPTSDAEDKYDIGYNCGYADAMSDIAES